MKKWFENIERNNLVCIPQNLILYSIHKLKIDEIKINEIVKMLERKSEEKLKNLDYRGAIKALRRAEKYISN